MSFLPACLSASTYLHHTYTHTCVYYIHTHKHTHNKYIWNNFFLVLDSCRPNTNDFSEHSTSCWKNPFSQRRPDWHLQILMVNKPIRTALSMVIWSSLTDLISLLSKTSAKCNVLHPLHITPPMMWTWAVWSFEWFHPKSMCHYCTFCAVCVPKFVSVCVCVHTFLSICSSPSVLSQCLHPNHNYNVISRVRQCPHCCFTFSSSSLLWISNALMLSSESCTALSPTHTCVYVCFRGGWVVG